MEDVYGALQNVQVVAFTLLGVLGVVQWRRHGSRASAWLAATFGVLTLVVLVGRLAPDPSTGSAGQFFGHAVVALLALFPYLLVRFTAAFSPLPRPVEAVAGALTVASVVGAFLVGDLPDDGEERSTLFEAYIGILLLDWVLLTAVVTWRLWSGGERAPRVARWRMRTLALGAASLAAALVGAASAPSGDDVSGARLTVQILALVSALLFMLGFSPPAVVRAVWRRRGEAALRAVERRLADGVLTDEEIASSLLPHACALLGGDGAVLAEANGRIVAAHQLDSAEARALVDSGSALASVPRDPAVLAVPLRNGWLAVKASAYTPFFGDDEVALVERLAALADLAIARSQLFAQLVEAQRIARVGSWEWDLDAARIVWSEEMYRLYGVDPATFEPSYETVSALMAPEVREQGEKELNAAVEERRDYEYEFPLTTPSGAELVLLARGSVRVDDAGRAVKLVGTVQDITERKRQEDFRDRFIANAAHELRTPLATLTGFVDLLASAGDDLDPAQRAAALDAMRRSGARASTLVNNLLDLSRLQEGRLTVRPDRIDLGELLHHVVRAHPTPPDRTLAIDVEAGLVVYADPDRLDQAVTNLLTNAFRYGGANVVVGGRREGDRVVVWVADDGEGVEESLVPELFEAFTRGARSSSVGGSGLGLAIVKMVVEATGGEVSYERNEPRGARFCIRLPAVA